MQNPTHDFATPLPAVVYFMQQATNGPIKIGYASILTQRYGAICSGSAYPIYVRAILPGRESLEAALHARFGDARMKGEWFHPGLDDDLPRFTSAAFRRLGQHIRTTDQPLADQMQRLGYIPNYGLKAAQAACTGLDERLIAEVPDAPPLKRNPYPFGRPDAHDTCECGEPKLVRSRRCYRCQSARTAIRQGKTWGVEG
jgi:hypothetical protein